MDVRETINEHPRAAAIGVGTLLAVAVAFFAWQRPGSTASAGVAQGSYFFSTDDGKTYFSESTEVYPFQHQGKTAYRAGVFKCGGGAPYVGYLLRYTDAAKGDLQKLLADRPANVDLLLRDVMDNGLEVKRPGEARWHPYGSEQAKAIFAAKCPGTGSPPDALTP